MGEFIERREHDEFTKRMEEEHERQNKRITLLEDAFKQFGSLTISVEKLALNMENMFKEQKKQGERLETLENRDGEMWRKVVGYIITCAVGLIVGYIFRQIGM
jgi:TolA-binding protein